MSDKDESVEQIAKSLIGFFKAIEAVAFIFAFGLLFLLAVFLGIFVWEWMLQHLAKTMILTGFVILMLVKALTE